jgi:hypothetical protein
LPVYVEEEAIAVITLFSKKDVLLNNEDLERNTKLINEMISFGLPNLFKFKNKYEQIMEVTQKIAKKG